LEQTHPNGAVIREAQPDDLEAMLEITQTTQAEHIERVPERFHVDSTPVPSLLLRRYFTAKDRDLWRDHVVFLVCELGGQIAGHVLITFDRASVGDKRHDHNATIADISLSPKHRGRGLGKLMLQEAMSRIRAKGATIASAHIWRGNIASERLFTSAGFTTVHQTMDLRISEPANQPVPPIGPSRWQSANAFAINLLAIFGASVLFAFLFAVLRRLLD